MLSDVSVRSLLSFVVVCNEAVHLGLRAASRHKFIGKEFGYKHLPLLAARGKCTHTDNVGIIAKARPLCRIYVRDKSSVSTFYFVRSDGNTDTGSAY